MNNKNVISITKIICYSLLILIVFLGLIFLPKSVLTYDELYSMANSFAEIKEERLIFLEYNVYGTENKFKEGLNSDVKKKAEFFKSRGELLFIKVYGKEKKTYVENDYWIEEEPTVVELNIEYYIITNLKIGETSLPCKTAISFINGLIKRINVIYLVVLIMCAFLIICPATIGVVRAVFTIKESKRVTN